MQSSPRAKHLRHAIAKALAFSWVLSPILGCRSPSGPAEAASASGAAPAGETSAHEALAGASADRAQAPSNVLEILDLGPGRFALRANAPVTVAATAQLERRSAGGFESAPLARGFRLTEGCDAPSTRCAALRAGEVLAPGGWNGGDCAGDCCPSGGAPDEQVFGGVYRVVVSQCDDPKQRWLGPAFELPKSLKAMYRARAAVGVESATVMQLNPLHTVNEVASDPGRVAGVEVVSGTEVPLSSEAVSALVRWMTGSGFDDQVVRRCKRADAFGFRLVRKPSGLAPETTEVAVDLACNSIGVVHEEGPRRLRSDAFFDASRAELIAILKSAMPSAVESSAHGTSSRKEQK